MKCGKQVQKQKRCACLQSWDAIWLPHGKGSWGFSGGWRGFAIDQVRCMPPFPWLPEVERPSLSFRDCV